MDVQRIYCNGHLYCEYQCKNGKLHGTGRRWYENGQLQCEYFHKNGKLDGMWREWHENGQLQSECYYIDNIEYKTKDEYEMELEKRGEYIIPLTKGIN